MNIYNKLQGRYYNIKTIEKYYLFCFQNLSFVQIIFTEAAKPEGRKVLLLTRILRSFRPAAS